MSRKSKVALKHIFLFKSLTKKHVTIKIILTFAKLKLIIRCGVAKHYCLGTARHGLVHSHLYQTIVSKK